MCAKSFIWSLKSLSSIRRLDTVKIHQDSINGLFIIWKVESVGSCRFQIHLCIPACIMSSEYTHQATMKFLLTQFSGI